MKKWFALVLAAALLAAVFCVPTLAGSGFDDMIKVLMSTPGVTITSAGREECASAEELDAAIENGADVIPEGSKLSPGRITVFQTRSISCDREVYDVSFKVWSTQGRTVALFFRAQDSETWELISCNQGDVIEGRFEACGTYVIAVGW